MANHMEIFEFCLFYLICFTALFSLTPLGSFPPRDIQFAFPPTGDITLAGVVLLPQQVYDLPWLYFIGAMTLGALLLIVAIALLGNTSFTILGTGVSWKVDVRYVCTIALGFIVGGGLGISMSNMMPPDMPLIAQFFLVWMWIVLLIYSVIVHAGGGSST